MVNNMALINCPECGKEISDKARECIHCGYTISKVKKNIFEIFQKHKILKLSIICIFILIILIVVIFSNGKIGLSKSEKCALNDINTLQDVLLDPNSMIIYEIYTTLIEDSDSNYNSSTLVYCGIPNTFNKVIEKWVVIEGESVYFEQNYSNSELDSLTKGDIEDALKSNFTIIYAKSQVELMNAGENTDDEWEKIDIEKIIKYIK